MPRLLQLRAEYAASGPHPKALQHAFKPKRPATDEYAVMLDARDALEVAPLPAGVENPDYVYSWRTQP